MDATSSGKKGQLVTAAFKNVLREGRRPTNIRTDKGQGFRFQAFNFLERKNINHLYVQNSEVKVNYAERVIKTMKSYLYGNITYKQSYRYVDKLPEITQHTIEHLACLPIK